MKYALWAKEQAEQWAAEYALKPLSKEAFEAAAKYRNSDADEQTLGVLQSIEAVAYRAGLAKAAEMIETFPTVYAPKEYKAEVWFKKHNALIDTHQAKLVGVRPIEEEKK